MSTERGMALLNALIIVAVVGGVSAQLLRNDLEAQARYAMMTGSDQARQHALAAEALARVLLRRDWDDGEVDHLGEQWARVDNIFPVEDGLVRGRIRDAQARFNINSLRDAAGALDAASLAVLERLVVNAGGTVEAATAVAAWVLDGSAPLPGAPGNGVYTKAEAPYEPAQGPMAGGSELRLVAGITGDSYRRLRPLVTALPGATAININTAPRGVLIALVPDFGEELADAVIEQRDEAPFESVEGARAFLAPLLSPRALMALEEAPLAVSSAWFEIDVEAEAGQGRARVVTILRRNPDDAAFRVHMRLEDRP